MATHNGEAGMAKIKAEFLILDHIPKVDTEFVSKTVKEQLEGQGDKTNDKDVNEPPAKKMKLKGRNKKRPKGKKVDSSEKLCPAIVQERICNYGDKCKFNHDKASFVANKRADIGDRCYLYDTYGKCDFGITCRFAKSHLTENFENMKKENFTSSKARVDTVQNILKKDLQVSLWKRKYDFSKSNKVLDKICPESNKFLKGKDKDAKMRRDKIEKENKSCDVPKPVDADSHGESADANKSNGQAGYNEVNSVIQAESSNVTQGPVQNTEDKLTIEPVGTDKQELKESTGKDSSGDVNHSTYNPCEGAKNDSEKMELIDTDVDKDVGQTNSVQVEDEGSLKLRPQEKKIINFADKLYLAPLTTVGNLPFRRICKEYGADITCGEMAVSTNLLQGQQSEWALLKRHESEDIYGVQVCGAYPDSMTRCAQLITETMDVDFIDINCGCPIDLIFNKGEGSALMGRLNKFEQIIKGMTAVIDVPLTAKIRTGIYTDKNTAHTLIPQLRDWGCALTTIHGRSRVQRYTKLADWDYISECAKAADPMPLFGNGDILSYEDANQRREQTGVSGVMIARGALIKPWIFTEIKEQRHWDISSHERFEMLKKFANYGLDHWGSDHQGVENTRRFLLEWLSFLYRYIPVGVLERVPQKINERPPYYKGRDDMETLLASPNCGDWIKLSEMLLGPVPEDFTFLPKHKANAYK